MNAFPENSTIVVVHGAWADGSCWTNVILPLQRHGLKVTCAPIPLTSLTDDQITQYKRVFFGRPPPNGFAGRAQNPPSVHSSPRTRIR